MHYNYFACVQDSADVQDKASHIEHIEMHQERIWNGTYMYQDVYYAVFSYWLGILLSTLK